MITPHHKKNKKYRGKNLVLKKRRQDNNETKIECGTNEELGADGKTCVCKNGYEKIDGVCEIKKTEEKDPEEESKQPSE